MDLQLSGAAMACISYRESTACIDMHASEGKFEPPRYLSFTIMMSQLRPKIQEISSGAKQDGVLGGRGKGKEERGGGKGYELHARSMVQYLHH